MILHAESNLLYYITLHIISHSSKKERERESVRKRQILTFIYLFITTFIDIFDIAHNPFSPKTRWEGIEGELYNTVQLIIVYVCTSDSISPFLSFHLSSCNDLGMMMESKIGQRRRWSCNDSFILLLNVTESFFQFLYLLSLTMNITLRFVTNLLS